MCQLTRSTKKGSLQLDVNLVLGLLQKEIIQDQGDGGGKSRLKSADYIKANLLLEYGSTPPCLFSHLYLHILCV